MNSREGYICCQCWNIIKLFDDFFLRVEGIYKNELNVEKDIDEINYESTLENSEYTSETDVDEHDTNIIQIDSIDDDEEEVEQIKASDNVEQIIGLEIDIVDENISASQNETESMVNGQNNNALKKKPSTKRYKCRNDYQIEYVEIQNPFHF